MAEEIKFNRNVFAGRIDTSRPSSTGLAELGDALKGLGGAFATIQEARQKKEFDEIVDLLSNPTLTVAEAEGLEQDASFPLAKARARQRQGELVVERREEEIRDRLAKAPDDVTGRQWLREEQAKDMAEFGDNREIQSGIRERYAKIAGSVLAETSLRRRAAQAQEAIRVEGEGFQLALENGGPITAMNRLLDSQFSLTVAAGDVDELQTVFLSSLDAYWKGGDNEELGVNTRVDSTVSAIDLFLDNGHMSAAIRSAFETKRDIILRKQQSDLNDPSKLGDAAMDRAHEEITQLVSEFRLLNPNTPIPKLLADRYLATARTAPRKEAVTTLIRAAATTGPNADLTDMQQVTQTRSMMLRQLTKDGTIELDEKGALALGDFDQTMLLLPLEMRNEQSNVLTIANEVRERLVKIASLSKTAEEALAEVEEEKVLKEITVMRVRMAKKLGPDKDLPPITAEFIARVRAARRKTWILEYNNRFRQTLIDMGIRPQDVVSIHFKR